MLLPPNGQIVWWHTVVVVADADDADDAGEKVEDGEDASAVAVAADNDDDNCISTLCLP